MSSTQVQPGRSENKLLAAERRTRIAELVDRKRSVSVAELKDMFGISAVTVRSDLMALEEEGRLKRMYGGAISINLARQVPVPKKRAEMHSQEKRVVASRAAQFVSDGDCIAIDTGSTTLELVRQLVVKRDLTIVTNDLTIAEFVEDSIPSADLMLLGGAFRRGHRYTYGQLSHACLDLIHMDAVFLATNSYQPGQGFMTEYEPVATVKSDMIAHSDKSYVLMDSSKVGSKSFIRFAKLSDVDVLVMDGDPDGTMAGEIASLGAKTHLVIV